MNEGRKMELTNQSIDRPPRKVFRKIIEKVPDHIAQLVVEEVLKKVGDTDWNDPLNVAVLISKIMSVDLDTDTLQNPIASETIRAVLIPVRHNNMFVPFWICQSIIRVDEKKNNRYIEYNGSRYNKIDIIFNSEYFKKKLDIVAKHAKCTWNVRWGNSKKEQNKLYQKIKQDDESWLEKCVIDLLDEDEIDGINIKDLIMIEFKRNLK